MVWKIPANVASFHLYFQRFKLLVGCWQECSFLNLITCDNFFEYLVKYITPNSVLQNSIEWLHVTFPGLFYNIIASIVVCLGCHDKIWETKGLREQKFIFSQFWKLQVQAQGVSRLVSPGTSFFGLQMTAWSSRGLSLCICIPGVCFCVQTLLDILLRIPVRIMASFNSITSLKALSPSTVTSWGPGD